MGGHHEVGNQMCYQPKHDRNRKSKSVRAIIHHSYHKPGKCGYLSCPSCGMDMLN